MFSRIFNIPKRLAAANPHTAASRPPRSEAQAAPTPPPDEDELNADQRLSICHQRFPDLSRLTSAHRSSAPMLGRPNSALASALRSDLLQQADAPGAAARLPAQATDADTDPVSSVDQPLVQAPLSPLKPMKRPEGCETISQRAQRLAAACRSEGYTLRPHDSAINLGNYSGLILGPSVCVDCSDPKALQQARVNKICHYDHIQQSIYTLARDIQGRSLSTPQKKILQRAALVRSELKTMLPFGRANVELDGKLINDRLGPLRHQAARRVRFNAPEFQAEQGLHAYARAAAITAVAGCGTCGDFANLAMALLARDLKKGERLIKQAADTDFDHAWVRFESVESDEAQLDSKIAVIVDGWADGPVFLPEDGKWTGGIPIKDKWSIDSTNSREFFETFAHYRNEATEAKLENAYEAVFTERLQDNGNPQLIRNMKNFEPTNALGEHFFERSRNATLGAESRTFGLVVKASKEFESYSIKDGCFDISCLVSNVMMATQSSEIYEKRFLAARRPIDLGLIFQTPPEFVRAPQVRNHVSRRLSVS